MIGHHAVAQDAQRPAPERLLEDALEGGIIVLGGEHLGAHWTDTADGRSPYRSPSPRGPRAVLE